MQEAPKDKNDNLYKCQVIKRPEKNPGNIRLAAVGDNLFLITNMKDLIYAELAPLIKNNNINDGEVALFKDAHGTYFIDLHLNYAKNPIAQQTFLSGIHAICQKHRNVIAGGDSNMRKEALQVPAKVYGARGCLTTEPSTKRAKFSNA